MKVALTKPMGWCANVEMTRRDLFSLIKLLLKPSILRFILFGPKKSG
jgi:hypothetical protein